MKRSLQLSILCIGVCLSLAAQDSHYWSQQFGTRSALLSGAVLGGANDNSMIFYNPGALGYLENSSISINASAYSIGNIRVENALGQQADFESVQIGSVPLLAGGMIRTGDEKWKIGYGIITPVDFSFKGIARLDNSYEVIDDTESPGLEELVAEAAVTTKTSEIMLALGVGRQLNDKWSIGLSNLFSVRSHSYQRNFSTYVFMNDENRTLVGANQNQNVEYYNVRYAAKLGLVYRSGEWSTGLTLTSPSINFFGNGTLANNIAVRNLKLVDDDRISGVATARQAELKSTFKSPFSVALGTNYTKGRSYAGIVVQYFNSIDPYEVMEPMPGTFVRPAELAPELQSDRFLRNRAGAESVLNVAIGYEHQLNESLALLASARNDISYFDESLNDGPGIKSTISSWDIYHFTAGVNLDHRQSSISLGLLYSTGNTGRYEQPGNIDPSNINLVEGSTTITEARYGNFGLLLGYTLNLDRRTNSNDLE
ncbi:hypothetical protein MKO06_11325 [Gramella sp. GC03-9]|uniref:Long-chain fatty acid transport protein n=1 Tax=Christiangramia oceanisediminis TaxID=2920386 RepID=A0A9X2KYD0_9FLAO|nr:hypothetical protein [Gramella oceanisediminis]MCP9200504.1 hypothetical protein [Gramella oceanisediminis]